MLANQRKMIPECPMREKKKTRYCSSQSFMSYQFSFTENSKW